MPTQFVRRGIENLEVHQPGEKISAYEAAKCMGYSTTLSILTAIRVGRLKASKVPWGKLGKRHKYEILFQDLIDFAETIGTKGAGRTYTGDRRLAAQSGDKPGRNGEKTSKFRGVSDTGLGHGSRKWQACFRHNYKLKTRHFEVEEAAARQYDAWVEEALGSTARLNRHEWPEIGKLQ